MKVRGCLAGQFLPVGAPCRRLQHLPHQLRVVPQHYLILVRLVLMLLLLHQQRLQLRRRLTVGSLQRLMLCVKLFLKLVLQIAQVVLHSTLLLLQVLDLLVMAIYNSIDI